MQDRTLGMDVQYSRHKSEQKQERLERAQFDNQQLYYCGRVGGAKTKNKNRIKNSCADPAAEGDRDQVRSFHVSNHHFVRNQLSLSLSLFCSATTTGCHWIHL